MSGSFIIESAFGQKRVACPNLYSCVNYIYELPYFRGNVEQVISQEKGFDAIQDFLKNIKIVENRWEIPEIRTKIYFISSQESQEVMFELEDFIEEQYMENQDER